MEAPFCQEFLHQPVDDLEIPGCLANDEKMGSAYTRWAPTSYKWSYKPYKWLYKWVTGVITLLIGVITPFITSRGPTLYNLHT